MTRNPFEVTKAVDYTDDEILDTFVDLPDGTFRSIADPASPMSQFLVSGKGGGRTHLMRFYSYSVQRERTDNGPDDLLAGLKSDGYLGIYMRCSGLNGMRFQGKGVFEDAWQTVFAYYMDAWILEHFLNVLIDINHRAGAWSTTSIDAFCARILRLLPASVEEQTPHQDAFAGLLGAVRALRRSMDRAINNAAFTRSIAGLGIETAPGQLIFEPTKLAAEHLPGLADIRITYLIDEYENLSEDQQMYVNTLIREKELPTSFLIGSRTPGVRTQMTLSAGEENRKGSEFELIHLDDAYKANPERYAEFCSQLALKRLMRSGVSTIATEKELASSLNTNDTSQFRKTSLLKLLSEYDPRERPHLVRLRDIVLDVSGDIALADQVVDTLRVEDNPLLERLRIHKFYQSFRRHGGPKLEAASEAAHFLDVEIGLTKEARNFVRLWTADLVAQIYASVGEKAPYLGLKQLVSTSGYLPRNFLIILKSIARWADFYGEAPFSGEAPIGPEAQIAGVLDACDWFSSDALPSGLLGSQCDVAIRRIGNLLSRARYSDKPTEVSFSAFSTSTQGVSEAASTVLRACVAHELLLEIPSGREDRNRGAKLRKFQLHPMLAPKFGLPSGRRGEMRLDVDGTLAVFDPSTTDEEYQRYVRTKLLPMRPPFTTRGSEVEVTLFDEE